MKKINHQEIVAIKNNVNIAFEEFKSKYKKVPKGIAEIKTKILLSNDFKEIKLLENKFFGYITKSLRAKKLKKELEET